eukprot:COSAG05_NODE_1864_length_3937_cov_21.205315_7_plen_275_part_00
MKLKRFLLRYYPPGIILEYESGGVDFTKPIDLLGLTPDVDVDVLLNQIIRGEPLLSEKRKPQLAKLVNKLIDKLEENADQSFYLFKILRAHILPLTNCAFNKSGDRFITGSYDRTCKVWNTNTGEEILTLEGHKNVVYAIAFNNPFGDKIVTGSFDKTARIWDAATGECIHTLRGHQTEIVALSFNPQSTMVATGSMDNTGESLSSDACVPSPSGARLPLFVLTVHLRARAPRFAGGLPIQCGSQTLGGGHGGGAGDAQRPQCRDCEPLLQQRG